MTAPLDGLVVMATIFRGGDMAQVQQGDQVWPGRQIMKIVDPKSMQVEGSVSQSDSSDLRIGQEAEVGLDAFSGVRYKGKVYSIGALAVGGWRENYYIRSIPVRVSIESYDSRVIPDLSAFCNITIARHASVLQVPLSAVREIGNDKGEVWVRSGDKFDRREVKLGPRNSMNVAVVEGLTAGEEVRIGS
jgi:multidrug efflux pump subunit AcrA (membrane-fusion protein)